MEVADSFLDMERGEWFQVNIERVILCLIYSRLLWYLYVGGYPLLGIIATIGIVWLSLFLIGYAILPVFGLLVAGISFSLSILSLPHWLVEATLASIRRSRSASEEEEEEDPYEQ